ncbi:MAG TPA: TetR/AcrR family transcriptional regulator [Desulfosalsimonadaceae bacterium]|nr:TetR/AcrR family transcriptional regulator [Desulfosalsimonadaceae bacterium]
MALKNEPKTARGENSRQRILETTTQLIGKSDSSSVTLDQIAEACQIAKSSILWYFGSKEELFLEVADKIFRNLKNTFIEQCPAHLSPGERFEFFLNNYESMLKANPEAPRIFFTFVFNSRFQEKIHDKIREIYEWNREAFCEQFHLTENEAVILLGALNGIVIQANVHPECIHIRDIFDELQRLAGPILKSSF